MKRIMIIAVGAILVGLVVAASLALSPGTQSTTDGISDAELIDLQAVADQKGMSLQAAIDRYAWNNDFAAAVAEIREAVPGAFTGAEIVDAGNAWVAFAGSAPAAAKAIVDTFTSSHSGVSVEVRADKGFTEVELEKAIEAAHFSVFNSPEVRDAATSFDFATGNIETIALLERNATDSALAVLRTAATNKIADATGADILSSISNSVVRFEGEVLGGTHSADEDEHLGGEYISIVIGDYEYACTSGFGVKDSSGVRGISTAGHCKDTLEDDGETLTIQGSDYKGYYGDFQWHTGPQDFSDDFFAGSDSVTETNERDVMDVGTAAVGQILCRNGITSHRDCQEVRKIHDCNGVACSLVQFTSNLCDDGDSGGPVYWGNTAYGIQQGWRHDPWPIKRELFSRADRMFIAISVYVATD